MKEFGSIPDQPIVSPQAATSRKPSLLARLLFGEVPCVLAKSLRDRPDQWRATNFELVHATGLEVWTANSVYGCSVNKGNRTLWGGVSALSTFGLSPGHWYLKLAADGWVRRRIRREILNLVATEAGE